MPKNSCSSNEPMQTIAEAIAEYAAAYAGTNDDLDSELEAASIECWLGEDDGQ